MHLIDVTGLDCLLELTRTAVGTPPVRVISPGVIASAGTATATAATTATVVAAAIVVESQLFNGPSLRQRTFELC